MAPSCDDSGPSISHSSGEACVHLPQPLVKPTDFGTTESSKFEEVKTNLTFPGMSPGNPPSTRQPAVLFGIGASSPTDRPHPRTRGEPHVSDGKRTGDAGFPSCDTQVWFEDCSDLTQRISYHTPYLTGRRARTAGG